MTEAKHAFILTLYFLMRCHEAPVDQLYDWAMLQCCMLGGDVDTNAAIAGGVIGAYIGIDHIDSRKLQKVLECKVENG